MMLARPGWLLTGVLAALVWTGARLAIPLLTAAAVNNGVLKQDIHTSVVYALIIALFPREFRRRYGDDMRDLLVDQLRAVRQRRSQPHMLIAH